MCKRARGKSAIGRLNWRDRWFILTGSQLTYWDKWGGPSAGGNQKGSIELNEVIAVEEVPEVIFSRPNMFQVIYADLTLYTQAQQADDRADWMNLIRRQVARNPGLVKIHHPGCHDGRWTCCGAGPKTAEGCQACFDYRYQAWL